MELTAEELVRAKEVRVEIMQSETPEGDCEVIAHALRQARAEGMERAAKICHALNLTLEYTHMLREELATLRENVRRLAETAKFLEVVAYPSSGLPDRYIVHKNEMNALRAALAPFAERKEPTDGR